ncbi:MAG: transglycosylase domain-containing protein [Bacillota bacterium]
MLKNIKIFLVILLVVLIIGFSAIFYYSYTVLSQPVGLLKMETNTVILDRRGSLMTELHGEKNRIPVSLDQVPENVRNAFIAIEDERFFSHSGVDLRAILRAFYDNTRKGEIVQGGSTITQQVIKMYYLSSERTYARKAKEAVLSMRFESSHDKKEILELYLNGIYLGEGAYGIQAASRTYFGKDASELTLAEGALLAGLTRAPSYYDPYLNPDAAQKRRNLVIDKMQELRLINSVDADRVRRAPLELKPAPIRDEGKKSFYIDNVIDEAINIVGREAVYQGGLKITTAYDPAMQSVMDRVIEGEDFQDDRVQCAVVLLDSEKGEILSLAGGRKYSTARGLNRATQMRRQPGSAIKPVAVYGPAFEMGYGEDSMVEDIQRDWAGYRPKNYDGQYWGRITIERAVQWSRNLAAVWLLDRIGVDRGYEFASRLGIKLEDSDRTLALALGGLTSGVTPLEMAGAYSAFASGGYYTPPHAITSIEDSSGKVIYRTPKPVLVMKPSTAARVTNVLKSVVSGGTARQSAVRGYEAAGKTGTTELPPAPTFKGLRGNKDAWFVGYVDKYTCSVWVGYDEKDMDRSHYLTTWGGWRSGIIFRKIMEGILEKPKSSRTK